MFLIRHTLKHWSSLEKSGTLLVFYVRKFFSINLLICNYQIPNGMQINMGIINSPIQPYAKPQLPKKHSFEVYFSSK